MSQPITSARRHRRMVRTSAVREINGGRTWTELGRYHKHILARPAPRPVDSLPHTTVTIRIQIRTLAIVGINPGPWLCWCTL